MTPNGALTLAALVAALASTQRAIAAPAPIIQPTLAGTAWTAGGVAILDSDLDAMLASDPALRGAHFGVFAVDTATGMPLYSHAADDEIQPASTLKLLVGSVAIEKLGPAKTFRTELLLTTAAPTLTAPSASQFDAVVLRAGGDPFLTDADLSDATRSLSALSLAPLRAVYVDASRFDSAPYPTGWTWDDFAQAYAPHVSALALDENVAEISVAPGKMVGAPAIVRSLSAASTRTMMEGCIAGIGNLITITPRAVTGSAGSDDTIDVRVLPEGCLEVSGSIPLGAAAETVGAAVYNPSIFAQSTLVQAMQKNGITPKLFSIIGPAHASVDAPDWARGATTTVWQHDSAPLSTWLGPRFWIPSDNLVGEMLLRELGYVTAGAPGTTDNGIAFEKQWLQSIGIDTTTVTLADGCGMSQYDRITPRDLVTILQHDWNGPKRQLVLDSLPVGGARGTIEGIAGTDAAGRVFAKTGSMMHVRGLAGYLAPIHHGAVTFAFQVDDWNGEYSALAALRARVLSRIIDDDSSSPK